MFLGPILGFFVEQDDKDLEKRKGESRLLWEQELSLM